MKIKKKCFGGRLGFYLRVKFPKFCGDSYLLFQRKCSNYLIKKYINKMKLDKLNPLFISIETITRCNGTCPFCPCNIHDEKRPFMYMSDELFKKIISDLKKINYSNTLMLLANNEILLDKNILERLKYARIELPNCHMKMFTNGKLLSIETFEYIINNNLVDEMIINNYNDSMKLNKSIDKVYKKYRNKDIKTNVFINLRYSSEILSNRSNSSPNKKGKKIINDYCVLPYTDININPEGKLLICCCDATEKTNLGNVKNDDLIKLFNGGKYLEIRKKMLKGRSNYSFCKYCDFNDVGTRRKLIKKEMKKRMKYENS